MRSSCRHRGDAACIIALLAGLRPHPFEILDGHFGDRTDGFDRDLALCEARRQPRKTISRRRNLRPEAIEVVVSVKEDHDFFAPTEIGGDTDRRPGPLSVSITAIGTVEQGRMVRRTTARPDCTLFVSGTIGEEQAQYAETVCEALKKNTIRVEKDFRNEKLGLKVREAQLEKIPYLLVIGHKESEAQTVAPRRLGGKNLPSMSVEEFLSLIEEENDPYRWKRES